VSPNVVRAGAARACFRVRSGRADRGASRLGRRARGARPYGLRRHLHAAAGSPADDSRPDDDGARARGAQPVPRPSRRGALRAAPGRFQGARHEAARNREGARAPLSAGGDPAAAEARVLVAALLRAEERVRPIARSAARRVTARRGRLAALRGDRKARRGSHCRTGRPRAAAMASLRRGSLVSDPVARRGCGRGRGSDAAESRMNPGLPDSTAFRRLKRSIARVGRTHYPRFLFGGGLSEGEIPVFTYHDIEASELEDDLRFLERNGYRTLSLDEYLDRMRASRPSAERCVLLTFDDARRSFWEAALPVLERRAAHAVLFTPTYWIADGSAARPDSDPPGFMSWEQIAHCERHALIDVEAHGHRHALVFTSSRLAGFATPSTLAA